MEIRLIEKDELPKILKFEKEYTKNDESLKEISNRFTKYPNLFIGCYENNELIGEVSGFVRGNIVILKSIAVKDERQKQGIGSKLIKFFERQAKKYCNIVSVASAEGYVESFYRKNGYKPRLIMIQIEKDDLPMDYKKRNYRFIDERDEGNTKFLYIKYEKHGPKFKEKLKKEFNAFEVNLIFEKKVSTDVRRL